MNLKKIIVFFKRNINYLIIISVLLFFFAGSFGQSFLEMMRLLKLKNDLVNQIAQSEEESSQLDEEIAQIGTQSYIEQIARKYLELYYPDEQIVIPVENSLSEQAKENQKKRQQQKADGEENTTDEEVTDEDIIYEEETTEDVEAEQLDTGEETQTVDESEETQNDLSEQTQETNEEEETVE